ncbi:ABC transporter ATP-binding protein [Phyllobacterium sp. 21LDTY02-6]|uniref:ABC transporter ATP-binding protein n=1 Tax=Phyllobacterium sp. 21LDTY02-6 TaxID=2944903 RepID=UPI002022821F|nr:ABC transporter ATP-binding protein [Phyllobacterium sp. 21LDTY02-6]MCO4318360.1 ABC transporter ATP-binding protein [Phyllobacterium sp. 21LDTY02-6]
MKSSVPETALELVAVSRSFGRNEAVKDVSLAVMPGEIVCLVGHSGCGKSSLLRIISGIDRQDRGVVRLRGREVAGPDVFVEPELRNIGFMFQDYALFPHLNVEENLRFGLRGMARKEMDQRVAMILDLVGLGALTGRYPHMLSGGEQQRVALARALAPEPDLLLMDEPFSNLDRGLREKLRHDTLSLLKSLGTTVVMVTHDPEEALSAGNKVVLMRAGAVVQSGSAYDIYDRPASAYAADFFTAFNKLPGTVRHGRIETPIGAFATALPEGSSATAYIRPHEIALEADANGAGTIRERLMMGEIEQLTVEVPGLAEPLRVRLMQRPPLDVARVAIRVRNEAVLSFPRD